MPRPLAPLAVSQLSAWEQVARYWTLTPVYLATPEGHREGPEVYQLHYTCGGMGPNPEDDMPYAGVGCGQSIFCLDNGHGPYHVNAAQILAAVTAHIRNVHRDLEERVYRDA